MKYALDEAQAGIKIAGRSVNNFTCADDTRLKKQRGAKKTSRERRGTKEPLNEGERGE